MVFLLLIVLLVLSLVIGLLVAGPWLMKIAARLVARVTKRPVVLLAMKRIAVLAPNVFRAVSGVVIALFAGSFWLATMGGVTALTQTIESADGQMDMRDNTVLVRDSQPLPSNKILALPGVKQQSNIYLDDKLGLVLACRDIPAFTVLHCPAGSDTKFGSVLTERRPSGQIPSDKVTAPSDKMLAQPAEVMLLTDGKANLDAIRNIVITANGGLAENRAVVSTKATVQADYLPDSYKELSQIVYVAIAFTLALAVISLIVSTIGGMLERKRSFFTLRLGGMTVGQLRGVMLVESLLPLVVVALIASALGVWLAKVFLSVLPYSMIRADLPPTYYAIVGASIALSLVAIYVVSRGLRRMTSPETNQSE
jgi:ABC-type antimicrobial peptide transport system permease subunit